LEESALRHPALLSQYGESRQWVLIRACRREQGLMLHHAINDQTRKLPELFQQGLRWVLLHSGTGTQRYLMETLSRHGLIASDLQTDLTLHTEREAAAAIATGRADAAPGTRAFAAEFGLDFLATGWESLDLALPRSIWFRHLFQQLIKRLKSEPCQRLAEQLTGYDLSDAGELLWGDE
jgi:molybdate-binding protein